MATVRFTAVNPGIEGNLILVQMIAAGSGPVASAVVTQLPGLNQWQIDVTYLNLIGTLCSAVAAALNGIPAVAALVSVFGDGDSVITLGPGFQRMTGGTTGQNVNTSFFFAQRNCEVGIMQGVGLKIRDWSGKAYMNDFVPAELIFGFDNSQTPGFPYPEIYIPANQAIYIDAVALGNIEVNGLLTLVFKGQKVYKK